VNCVSWRVILSLHRQPVTETIVQVVCLVCLHLLATHVYNFNSSEAVR